MGKQGHSVQAKKGQERQTFRDKQEERVFYIRLKQSNSEIDLSPNSNLVQSIKMEYAVRYLEVLNIEPTQKNIAMILNLYPLENCEFSASWKNDTGLYADTIIITTRKKQDKRAKEEKNTTKSQEAIENLKLGKVKQPDIMLLENNENNQKNKYMQDKQNNKGNQNTNNSMQDNDGEEKKEELPDIIQGFRLDYNPESIKKKYIYPFNQTFQRKMNIALKDDDQYIQKSNNSSKEKYLIYEQPQFNFPFTQVKLENNELQDLQHPLVIETQEIKQQLEIFIQKFPRQMIPTKQSQKYDEKGGQNSYMREMRQIYNEDNKNKQGKSQQNEDQIERIRKENMEAEQPDMTLGRYITFNPEEVHFVFKLLLSDEMARLVGLASHFIYWVVFGNVNPIQIDTLAKKQMYIMMHELKEYFSTKLPSKLWNSLGFPLLLLTLKMNVELILKESYKVFFEENTYSNNSCGTIAMDKVFNLIDKIFDETNFYGRFIFLESDFKTMSKQGNVGNDRKYMRRRLHATSPFLDIMINKPQDSKTRNMLAKRHVDVQQQIGSTQPLSKPQHQNLKSLGKTVPNQYYRADKSIYSSEDEISKIKSVQKKKMVKMVMGKVLPKIEAKIGKKSFA